MRGLKRIVFVIVLFCVGGCAWSGLEYNQIDDMLATDDCSAVAFVTEREEKYGAKQKLLYLLDAGAVNMFCGNHEESNRFFLQADELSQELWTKSLSREAASYLANDYTIPYGGADFEKALINLFSAINYFMLGRQDEALVECGRLDEKLAMFNDRYQAKNVYKEDAFGRYLGGIIYEAAGELDDAFIDYLKAYKTYNEYGKNYGTRMPNTLVQDLLRVAGSIGRLDEVEETVNAWDMPVGDQPSAEGMGKIVFIHFNGRAPVKVEDSVVLPSPSGPVPLAFPKYVTYPPGCRDSEFTVDSGNGVQTRWSASLVEDINRIALKDLNDFKSRIVAKAVARAALKQAVIYGATESMDDENAKLMVRLFLNVLNLFLERADTRSWRTLPGEISLARAFVPEGTHDISVQFCGAESKSIGTIRIRAGETKFIFINTRF